MALRATAKSRRASCRALGKRWEAMIRDVFRSHCTARMAEILNKSISVKWRTEERIKGGVRIDLLGEGVKALYLLELEMRREDPVNNVVKLWRTIEECLRGRMLRRIVLIQVFSAFYKPGSAKKANATFAGTKMAEALRNAQYKTFDWDLTPPVAGKVFPQDTDEQIRLLCDEIVSFISAADT